MKIGTIAVAAAAFAVFATPRSAKACNTQFGYCLTETNTGASPSYGIYAQGTGGAGVIGEDTSSGYGIYGSTVGGKGVYGDDTGSGYGMFGISTSGVGVYGQASSGDAMQADNTGNGYGLYAFSTGGDAIHGVVTNGNSAVAGINNNTSGNAIYGQATGGGYAGNFDGDVQVENGYSYYYNNRGTCVAGHCASDQRLKKNIEPMKGAMAQLLSLRGVTFEWRNPEEHGNQAGTQTGFIAQEVERTFPGWVDEDHGGFKGIVLPPLHLAALQVESIRELKTENDVLRARTSKLEERLNALENGRDPVTGGVGVGRGTLLLVGLGLAGLFGISRRKRNEKKA
jgi:hypothetical protein